MQRITDCVEAVYCHYFQKMPGEVFKKLWPNDKYRLLCETAKELALQHKANMDMPVLRINVSQTALASQQARAAITNGFEREMEFLTMNDCRFEVQLPLPRREYDWELVLAYGGNRRTLSSRSQRQTAFHLHMLCNSIKRVYEKINDGLEVNRPVLISRLCILESTVTINEYEEDWFQTSLDLRSCLSKYTALESLIWDHPICPSHGEIFTDYRLRELGVLTSPIVPHDQLLNYESYLTILGSDLRNMCQLTTFRCALPNMPHACKQAGMRNIHEAIANLYAGTISTNMPATVEVIVFEAGGAMNQWGGRGNAVAYNMFTDAVRIRYDFLSRFFKFLPVDTRSHLRQLHMQYCGLQLSGSNGMPLAHQMHRTIPTLANLEVLLLAGNSIAMTDLTSLFAACSKLRKLRFVDVSENPAYDDFDYANAPWTVLLRQCLRFHKLLDQLQRIDSLRYLVIEQNWKQVGDFLRDYGCFGFRSFHQFHGDDAWANDHYNIKWVNGVEIPMFLIRKEGVETDTVVTSVGASVSPVNTDASWDTQMLRVFPYGFNANVNANVNADPTYRTLDWLLLAASQDDRMPDLDSSEHSRSDDEEFWSGSE